MAIFSLLQVLGAPLCLMFLVCIFFRFRAARDYYGAQEDCPSQATPLRFHIPGDTSPSERSALFHLSRGRTTLPRVSLHPFLRPRAGFFDLECVLQFHHSESRLADPVCSPNPRSGPVVCEFYSNLPFQVGSTVFIWSRWVDFGARAINWFYQLREDDGKEYQRLFVDTDFEGLMQELTQGQGMWRRHPSTGEFTTFSMIALMPVVKVWYNFLSIKIKP